MLYNIAIAAYGLLVKADVPFNKKARLMVEGHRQVFRTLQDKIEKGQPYLWFHAASLGEFEQGRPLMERIRALHPQYKILLTFFSPSGYEVRKDYKGADVVCYLPFDRKKLVRRFLDLVQPRMAFFIKYEFWKNYLDELHRRGIPTYSVSSIFRPNQIFFKPYASSYAGVLRDFDCLFVQNEESRQLLAGIGIDRVKVVGDTRFDRVSKVMEEAKALPIVEAFRGSRPAFVAGSSWQPDEDLFIPYFNRHREVRLIIAPHVIDEDHLQEIECKLELKSIRYTQATEATAAQAECLIIDCFGLLSSIYRYGEAAYIGGGFGEGIHNTLEAAVYGIPIVFGPRHQKFAEAVGLLQQGGAFCISTAEELDSVLDKLLADDAFRKQSGQLAGRYVHDSMGATDKILSSIKL